jgi:cobalt-zinc-cadmium efflux system outer membrane protein
LRRAQRSGRPLALGLAIFWCVAGQLSFAAEAAAPLALDALVAEIVGNNPELKFYEAEIDAAKAGRRSVGALAHPELSVEAGRKRVRDLAGVLAGEGTAWSVSVTQTFEWPGRLALRKSIANRQIELAELGLERFRAALASRARLLTYAVMVAQEKAATTNEVGARYQQLRETFLARDPAGITPMLETRAIEAQELALKRRATEAELAAKAALVELNQLRGAPVDASIRMQGVRVVFHAPPALDALLSSAREKNFEFRMKRVELDQQGLEVSLARHQRYPAVSVSPFYSEERAGERESVLGVGISVPLPLTQRTRATVEVSEARRRQAETALLIAQRDLEREVITTFQAFEAKLAATANWQPDTAEKFREAAGLADRHYRLGAVPLATYVELQSAYLDAVEAILDTKREALATGQQLQLLTGHDFKPIEITP